MSYLTSLTVFDRVYPRPFSIYISPISSVRAEGEQVVSMIPNNARI